MKDLKTIYTLGTSNRSMVDFFSVLETYKINYIADVRRFPKSRKYPHFNRDYLEAEAKARDLFYQWLGDLLGGYRSGGYEAYMREVSFQRGLQKVEHLAKEISTVLICAERLPWKCHRFKISYSLTEKGLNVVHIIERNRIWQPNDGGKEELNAPGR
jgi:uncharacterized protein (DUF488 family)